MTNHEPAFDTAGDLTRLDLMLIDEYLKAGVPVDRLAYTEQFDQIYRRLQDAGDPRTRSELFARLLNLRKSGRLPRLVWTESA